MTLTDAITNELPRLQVEAEALMVDAVTISRAGGERVFDETTGDWTTPAGSTIYAGKAKIRLQGVTVGYDREVGGGDIRVNTLILAVPAGTPIEADDIATVTASRDADLVGRKYRVTDVMRSTWQITRKAMLEEIT